MQPRTETGLSKKETIDVLLHEYDSLRAEIRSRTGIGFQFVGIGAALFVLLLKMETDWRLWIAIAVSVTAICCGHWFVFRDIITAAARVQELEKIINDLAGEELLVWETRYGVAANMFREPRIVAHSELPEHHNAPALDHERI